MTLENKARKPFLLELRKKFEDGAKLTGMRVLFSPEYAQHVIITDAHCDEITTNRRANPKGGTRDWTYLTVDGNLYTKNSWAITRGPQNLQDNEAYLQLVSQRDFFPDPPAAQASFEHADTVVVDLEGLELYLLGPMAMYFIDPKQIGKSNSQQRLATQRIFGPDEENLGLNMEMFAEAGIVPSVVVPSLAYVQDTLKRHGKEVFGRASWLYSFGEQSTFNGGICRVELCRDPDSL